MVSNAAALLLASEVNLLANYWKLKIIPISHTAANNKLLILSWLEELCGLPEQDNYLATLSRPHQAAFRGVHLPLSPQSLIIWCPGEDLENSSLPTHSKRLCYVLPSHCTHRSSERERGSSTGALWLQTELEMFLGLLLSLAALGEVQFSHCICLWHRCLHLFSLPRLLF